MKHGLLRIGNSLYMVTWHHLRNVIVPIYEHSARMPAAGFRAESWLDMEVYAGLAGRVSQLTDKTGASVLADKVWSVQIG